MRNCSLISFLLSLSMISLGAQDALPSLSSTNADERLRAKEQVFKLFDKMKEEPRRILRTTPRIKETVPGTHPVMLSLQILGELRAYESYELIIKHVATAYFPDSAFSEIRLDYLGQHPAIQTLKLIGPQVMPNCLDKIELADNPDMPCLLVAIVEISGSNVLAKQALRERIVVLKDKDVQARLKNILTNFDKLVLEEVEKFYPSKLTTVQPDWDKIK